jgi:hypothetical protein
MSRRRPLVVAVVALLFGLPGVPIGCRAYPASTTDAAGDASSAGAGGEEWVVGGAGYGGAIGSSGTEPSHAGHAGDGVGSEVGGGSEGSRGGGAGADTSSGGEGTGPDAGGGAGAGMGPAREPSSFEGLVLALVASSERCATDGQLRISRCVDGSGHANHAEQNETKRQPTLVHDALHGHAVIHFGAVDAVARPLVVADASSLHLARRDFVVAMVARWTNSTDPIAGVYGGYGMMLSKQTKFDPYWGLVLLANYPSINGTYAAAARIGLQLDLVGSSVLSSSTKLNDGVFRLFVGRRIGSNLEVRINGVAESRMETATVSDISTEGYPLIIGGSDGAPLIGDVAEIAIIGGAVTESDLSELERYFIREYAL